MKSQKDKQPPTPSKPQYLVWFSALRVVRFTHFKPHSAKL